MAWQMTDATLLEPHPPCFVLSQEDSLGSPGTSFVLRRSLSAADRQQGQAFPCQVGFPVIPPRTRGRLVERQAWRSIQSTLPGLPSRACSQSDYLSCMRSRCLVTGSKAGLATDLSGSLQECRSCKQVCVCVVLFLSPAQWWGCCGSNLHSSAAEVIRLCNVKFCLQ